MNHAMKTTCTVLILSMGLGAGTAYGQNLPSLLQSAPQQNATPSSQTGCGDPTLSPASKQICQDNETYNQTIWGGAGTGALVGAGLGAAVALFAGARDPREIAKYAAAGGAVGGALGGLDGYLTAKKEEASAQKVRQIDAVAQDVRKENDHLTASIATAKTMVAEGRQRLADTNSQLRAGTISLSQAQAQKAKVEFDGKNLQDMINGLIQRREQFIKAASQSGDQSPDCSAQINELTKEIVKLERERDSLVQALKYSTYSS